METALAGKEEMDRVAQVKGVEPLFERIVTILEQARSNVVRTVNSQMVIAYWLIGREIVEEEQHGKTRAEYGKRLIKDLSRYLTKRYGKGFSVANIRNFRQFYIVHQERLSEIRYPAGSESVTGFHPDLSWSHYRALMRVENKQARSFYEIEAARNRWNKRQIERQINSRA